MNFRSYINTKLELGEMSSFSSFQNSKLGLGKFKNSYFELFSGFNSKILNAINLELGNLELGKNKSFDKF